MINITGCEEDGSNFLVPVEEFEVVICLIGALEEAKNFDRECRTEELLSIFVVTLSFVMKFESNGAIDVFHKFWQGENVIKLHVLTWNIENFALKFSIIVNERNLWSSKFSFFNKLHFLNG